MAGIIVRPPPGLACCKRKTKPPTHGTHRMHRMHRTKYPVTVTVTAKAAVSKFVLCVAVLVQITWYLEAWTGVLCSDAPHTSSILLSEIKNRKDRKYWQSDTVIKILKVKSGFFYMLSSVLVLIQILFEIHVEINSMLKSNQINPCWNQIKSIKMKSLRISARKFQSTHQPQ